MREAVRSWGQSWARGWATHDAKLIASLYEDGAVFRSQPFREPQDPGGYAAWAFEDEERAEVWFAEPIVEGDRALVEWWAISHGRDGRDTTLAGAASLWFGADGRVRRQLDYWNQADDTAQPPPEGWGPVLAHEARARR
jgi:ketosteroid isomerase-like protein